MLVAKRSDYRRKKSRSMNDMFMMLKLKRQQIDNDGEVPGTPHVSVNGISDHSSPPSPNINNHEGDTTNEENLDRLADSRVIRRMVKTSRGPLNADFAAAEASLVGETEEDAEIRKAALQSRSRSRSSTIVQIPTASIQMDLHTLYLESVNAQNYRRDNKKIQKTSLPSIDDDNEKKSRRFALLKQKFRKDGNNNTNSLEDFRDFLEHIRSNLIETPTHELAIYKDMHWSTLNKLDENVNSVETEEIMRKEKLRFEALWELFYAEITYLIDHILVLQNVFAKSFEHAKAYGFLGNIDETVLFGNLEKLIEVTSYFAKKLLEIFQNTRVSIGIGKSTEIIVDAFKQFDAVLFPEYNTYCVNYQQAKQHLDSLKEDEIFAELTKWCRRHECCKRLDLEDFLVAPLQHLTKYPLLLKAIRKQTPKDDINNKLLTTTIINIEKSIQSINSKMSEYVNLQRLQQIQESVRWPSLLESEQKCFVPELVRAELTNCSCESLLMNPKRRIINEGILTLTDSNKTEFYVFLFDDMVLLTKQPKKTKRRNTGSEDKLLSVDINNYKYRDKKGSIYEINPSAHVQYIVYKQPIPMDRLKFYDLNDQSTNVKNAFCLVHINRYQQPISVYTFQTNSSSEKHIWVRNFKEMIEQANYESSSSKELSSDDEHML